MMTLFYKSGIKRDKLEQSNDFMIFEERRFKAKIFIVVMILEIITSQRNKRINE